MNKRIRRIERELGEIQMRKSATGDQFITDLQIFSNLHKKRWNRTDTPSMFMDSRYCDFYSEVGLQLLPKGQIGLCVLEAGNVTLALFIFFTFGHRILLQLNAYDPDYSYYSPMVVLIEQFVDEKLASGITEIDFGSYYPYKESWANQLKNRLNLRVFPNGFLPSTAYVITRLYLGLRSRIREHPRVLNMMKIALRRARVLK